MKPTIERDQLSIFLLLFCFQALYAKLAKAHLYPRLSAIFWALESYKRCHPSGFDVIEMPSIVKVGKMLERAAKRIKKRIKWDLQVISLLVSIIFFAIGLYRTTQIVTVPVEVPKFVQVPKLEGDVDENNVVDYDDLILLGRFFETKAGHRYWDPRLDLNEDGKINVLDLSIVGMHFGDSV